MANKVSPIVQNDEGLLGVLEHPESVRSDSDARIAVRLTRGQVVLVPPDLMVIQKDGSFHIDLSTSDLLKFDAEEPGQTKREVAVARGAAEAVVPVIAETVEVVKRQVESGRVRVEKTVQTTDQVVNESLIHEDVEVERVPINKVIEAPIGNRQEGETLVVPVLKEVLVVEKRLMLVEEIRITRRKTEQPFSQTVPLRTEAVVVEQSEPTDPEKPVHSSKRNR